MQVIAREEREAARSQDLLQGVDDHVRRVLRAWTQVEYRNTLREGTMASQSQSTCVAA